MNRRNVIENLQKELFAMQDLEYRNFHMKLMPTVNPEKIIGIRTPALRAFAKKIRKDYTKCVKELDRFLPYVDNWATCDLLAMKIMKKHLDVFIEESYRITPE